MTGDDTENVPEQMTDAAAAASSHPAAPAADDAAVILTDAERAVPDFEVPAPPSFDNAPSGVPVPPPASLAAAAADLPVPAAAAAEPVIPPPPVFDNSLRDAVAAASPERPATRRAAQQSQPVPRAAVSYVDVAPSSTGTDDRNGYRGWSVAIYTGLTLLFLGAIGMMGFLAFSG